ncbi:hypothetical protein MPNT_90055 [Candidatus Methylacidithermus pantelleriae]|uniref:Uncharacterized protein n=1 Tax=Candidatus Methylacidithermus pantelleriae TaxID=2744239 RepID=A0A8J2FTL7_9BACT|nr:hypothetical protein MPNT_90055 [Candidatus Methylacidithermus pantelleriae]
MGTGRKAKADGGTGIGSLNVSDGNAFGIVTGTTAEFYRV